MESFHLELEFHLKTYPLKLIFILGSFLVSIDLETSATLGFYSMAEWTLEFSLQAEQGHHDQSRLPI